jgi:hypothetical protein
MRIRNKAIYQSIKQSINQVFVPGIPHRRLADPVRFRPAVSHSGPRNQLSFDNNLYIYKKSGFRIRIRH